MIKNLLYVTASCFPLLYHCFCFYFDIDVEPHFFCCLFQFFFYSEIASVLFPWFSCPVHILLVSMWACWPTRRWGFHCSCQRSGFACRWKIWSCSWEWYLCLSSVQLYDNGKVGGSKEDSRFKVVNTLCWYGRSVLSGGMRSCCCALLLATLM